MKEIITSAGETVAIDREPKALTLFAGATYGVPGTIVLNARDTVHLVAELLEAAVEVDRDGTAASLDEFIAGIATASAGDQDRFGVLDRICALLGVEPEPIDTLEERLGGMAAEKRAALGLDSSDSASLIESLKAENQAVRDDFADLCQAAGLENCDAEGARKKVSELVQERDGLARTLGLFISTAGIAVGEPEAMVAELAKVVGSKDEPAETGARAEAAASPAPGAETPPDPASAPVQQPPKATPSKRGGRRRS